MATYSLETDSVGRSSEMYFEEECDVCLKTKRHAEATKTCLDCRQRLCRKCHVDHDKFDAMMRHRVVDKVVSVQSLQKDVSLPTELCEEHYGKLVDMYCEDHDHVCCSACINIHHRRCNKIEYVPTISSGIRTSPRLQATTKNIRMLLNKLKHTKMQRQDAEKRIQEEKLLAETNIQNFKEELMNAIDSLERKALDEIQAKYEEFQKSVNADCERLDNFIATLETVIEGLLPDANQNESQLFVWMKKSKEHIQQGDSLFNEIRINIQPREGLHFNTDNHIKEFIDKLESFGELKSQTNWPSVVSQHSLASKDNKQTCWISDICEKPDGKFLMTDNANGKLLYVDDSFQLMTSCTLSGAPESICLIAKNKAAITLPIKKLVQFVTITDNTIIKTKSVLIGATCHGIAYSQDVLFITCGGFNQSEGSGEVCAFTLNGDLLYKLPRPDSKRFWTCPYSVALTPDDRKIIVTDRKHGVVTMDTGGRNVTMTKMDACDLSMEGPASWFVSADVSLSIYRFNTRDRSYVPVLKEEDGIKTEVTALCYQATTGRLIVAFSQDIKVFQLHRPLGSTVM